MGRAPQIDGPKGRGQGVGVGEGNPHLPAKSEASKTKVWSISLHLVGDVTSCSLRGGASHLASGNKAGKVLPMPLRTKDPL